ncbi:XAC2610-related protein [Pedobacter sandarakinus]|uniref:XAC2610-related protein n=1 Tax=Pedobacter sandarakinus TaxID=353156 RepID=UPI0022480E66|nr:hypothetical protein [Pedobacter sandarakinus]MCX2574647.1 hypothetical protein [Pedobacter sandarakinus]
MKKVLQIFIIGMLPTLCSCVQSDSRKTIATATIDTLQTRIDKQEKERLLKRRAIEDQDYADSLRLDKVLQNALVVASKNIEKNRFIQRYEVLADSIQVRVEINLGYHFTKKYPHLIIRRSEPSTFYIDIYTKSGKEFKKVISHEQWNMTYLNDTIQDINGDGRNDFVVNWYGSTGCCLKAFSNVYLLRQDKKAFSENLEFINPTFSPKEKIIRGVRYGHPGETEMYKYKWNGEKVDTLEYVSYEKHKTGKTGKIIISTGLPYADKFKILKILNSVPREYNEIEGYDWFTGNGYK